MKKQRRYTAEFKAEAVRLAQQKGRTIAEVARALGVQAQVLRYWLRAETEEDVAPEVVRGPESLAAENRRLKREIARLEEERDILKKAAAYFAQASR